MAYINGVTLLEVLDKETNERKHDECYGKSCDVIYSFEEVMIIRFENETWFTSFVTHSPKEICEVIEVQTEKGIYRFKKCY